MARVLLRLVGMLSVAFLVISCSSSTAQTESVTAADAALQNNDPWVEVENMVYNANYRGAIDAATDLMNAEGKSVRGLTLRGIAYAKFNKQFNAYEDLIEATEMDRNFDTLMNIGNALRMYGHCDRAGDAYRQALMLSPGNVEAIVNLTSAYLCMGDLDLANQTIQESFAYFPKDAVSYTNIAILKHMNGDAEDARQAAKKALQADENYTPAWQVLYQSCVSLGDKACYTDAKQQYDSRIGLIRKSANIKKRSSRAK